MVVTPNLAEVVDEAKRLSSTYALAAGNRGFDVLHFVFYASHRAQKKSLPSPRPRYYPKAA
jgi:hypothetical protein